MGQEQSTMQQPEDRTSDRFSSAPSYKEVNNARQRNARSQNNNTLQGTFGTAGAPGGYNTEQSEHTDRIRTYQPGEQDQSYTAGPSGKLTNPPTPSNVLHPIIDEKDYEESAVKRAAPSNQGANNKTNTAHFGYAESGHFGNSADPSNDHPTGGQHTQDSLQQQWEQSQQLQQPLYDERKREIIEKLLYNDTSLLMDTSAMKKTYTQEESQQLVNRLLEKGRQIETRNHLTTDYYDQREIENCTFQPNTVLESITVSRQLSPKRSLQEFLSGQNKFLAGRQENLKRVQSEMENKEKQECSHAPQILQTSPIVMIQSKATRKYDSEPAYKRLFDLQKKNADAKKTKEQQKTEEDVAASKANVKKSNPKTIDRLYNLGKKKVASKREGVPLSSAGQKEDKNNEEPDYKQSQSQQQNQQSGSKQVGQISQPSQKQSEFLLATKLIKEYEHIVSIVVEDAKKQAYLLDYIQMSEILRLMGFVSFTEKVESHNFVKERTLVNDMWIVLEGSQNGGVSYRNILLFIFALMGIDIDLPKFKKNDENQVITIQPSKDHAFPLLRDAAEPKREEVQEQIEQIQQLRQSRISQNQQGSIYNIDDLNSKGGSQSHHQSQQQLSRAKIDYEVNGSLKQWVSQRSNDLRIGTFDADQNMMLTAAEVKHIQLIFYLFYVNRLHTEKEKQKYLNQQGLSSPDGFTSNRQLTTAANESKQLKMSSPHQTEQLAQNYRSRMWEQTVVSNEKLQRLGDRIQHADILMAQKEEQRKNLDHLKELRKDEELLECTFHPKTNNYTKASVMLSPYSSHQQQMQSNGGTNDFNDPNALLSATGASRPNNNPMPPTSMGNKRYLDLYNLAKPRSQLRDKKTHEVEYEKNCDECTFNPDTGASNGPRNLKEVDIKNKEATVERMRKAWEDNQSLQLKLSRGYYEFKDPRYKTGNLAHSQNSQTQMHKNNSQLKRPFTGGNTRVDSGLHHQQQYQQQQQEMHSQMSGNSGHQQQSQQLQHDGPNDYYPERYDNQHGYEEYHDEQGHDEHGNMEGGVPQFGNLNGSEQNHEIPQDQGELQHEDENQQNYEWMNNSEGKQDPRHPLLFVDINLAADKIERVVVYEGDRPEDLARDFILKHGIDENFHERLTQMLQMQIEANHQQQQQHQE